nr:hypothetical protein [Tanacetum cinerariifolium]
MEAGSKDRPPILAPGNYVQWKFRIRRYIDTKPNHELIHYCLKNPSYKFMWADKQVSISKGSHVTRTETYMETYKNISQDIRDQLNAKAEAVQFILTGIDNDIYSTVDACPNACEMWKAIERAERIARVANPLVLVAQQQPVYHPQNHPTHYTQNSLTRSQQAAIGNRGKTIVNSPQPIYDQKPSMVAQDDETSKDKEIDKLMAIISLSFKKIYKPTNNNLRTSSNTSRENQDNSPRINISSWYKNQRIGNVARARETVRSTVVQKSGTQCYNCKEFGNVARECQKPKRVKDAASHREKMLLYQELEAHYMYMAQLQEVSPDGADSRPICDTKPVQKVSPDGADSRPIFDTKPVQKVSTDDHYNVFSIENEHPEQSESIHDTYPIEQDEHNVIIDSLDMGYDREQIDQNDDDDDDLVLIEKLKGEIEDFKNKNKSLESSNSHFEEANNKLFETNNLLYNDFKKSQAELARRNDVEYASKVEIDCAKAKGYLISYKIKSQKSFNKYTQTINDLNHTISKMKEKLCAYQETISILSQQNEAQIKLYKTHEDNELDKVIALEKKVKVLDNIVYKTGQSVQMMNMLNNKCQTSFAKPEFLKKAQRANPHLLLMASCVIGSVAVVVPFRAMIRLTRLKMDQSILHLWLILLQALEVQTLSQQSDKSKTSLGYDSQGVDSQELENQVNDKTGEGYHAVPPPYTGNYMPSKLDLVLADEHVANESVTSLPNIAKNEVKTSETPLKNVSAPIIKD